MGSADRHLLKNLLRQYTSHPSNAQIEVGRSGCREWGAPRPGKTALSDSQIGGSIPNSRVKLIDRSVAAR
jgi:hypothetical protein